MCRSRLNENHTVSSMTSERDELAHSPLPRQALTRLLCCPSVHLSQLYCNRVNPLNLSVNSGAFFWTNNGENHQKDESGPRCAKRDLSGMSGRVAPRIIETHKPYNDHNMETQLAGVNSGP